MRYRGRDLYFLSLLFLPPCFALLACFSLGEGGVFRSLMGGRAGENTQIVALNYLLGEFLPVVVSPLFLPSSPTGAMTTLVGPVTSSKYHLHLPPP